MYRLVGSPKSRGFRVLWMLEELQVEYQLERAGPHSEAALAVNPSGKIPVLIDDDQPIIDSVAIVQYLADKHQQFTAKAGTLERAQQDSFTCFAVDDIDGILWTNAKHDFVLPENLRSEAVNAACRWDLQRAMVALEKRLGDATFVMGDSFTVPDLLIGHCAGWMERSGFDWPEGKLADYLARIRQRPAFKRATDLRNAG